MTKKNAKETGKAKAASDFEKAQKGWTREGRNGEAEGGKCTVLHGALRQRGRKTANSKKGQNVIVGKGRATSVRKGHELRYCPIKIKDSGDAKNLTKNNFT